MFTPLVLPETLGCTTIGGPVCVHVIEQGALAGCGEDGGDVGVGAIGIAIGIVGAVAVVGPEAMDCPGVNGTGGWVGIPELSLLRRCQ